MLDPTKLQHIQRLLASGEFSQRQVARLAGVSRPVVAAMLLAQQSSDDADHSSLARCPGCGGLVYLPCRACTVRQSVRFRR